MPSLIDILRGLFFSEEKQRKSESGRKGKSREGLEEGREGNCSQGVTYERKTFFKKMRNSGIFYIPASSRLLKSKDQPPTQPPYTHHNLLVHSWFLRLESRLCIHI